MAAAVVAAMLVPPSSRASGGRYEFDGGTPRQRAAVTQALDASSFDWSVVPVPVTIHIARGVTSSAQPGHIWLDADLLEAGEFAWGVVQHEYAHQVDFFVLRNSDRRLLSHALGASTWCNASSVGRARLGCERFASAVAWSYWPSRQNCMKPDTAQVLPAHFRRLVSELIRLDVERRWSR